MVSGGLLKYSQAGVEMHGYMASPAGGEAARPGVLVVHEWWGLDDYARHRADLLAALGYPALAVDLYGAGKTAASPDQAAALMHPLANDLPLLRARFMAALDRLRAQSGVDPQRIGAIGFCFGGGVVLHMARAGAPLKAVASFHGNLALAIAGDAGQLCARIAVYNGEADSLVSAESIAAFEADMRARGARYQLLQLPGARHGFSNPAATARARKFGMPVAYDDLADAASWAHMQLVFREVFSA